MKRKRKPGVEAAQITGPLGEGKVIAVVKEEPRWATVYIEGTAAAVMFIPNP